MSQPQTAICAPGGAFGIFITLLVAPGQAAALRPILAQLPAMTQQVADMTGEPGLVSSIAIGATVWNQVMGSDVPPGLLPFAPLQDGARHAPATPADLFLHIHSPRHDANFALARRIMGHLGGLVRMVEEIHGFSHMGGRDLTGFVDGTENPTGDERAEVALLADGPHAGGSYVSLQRYVHNLPRWEGQSVHQQEATIGRTKDDDQELDDAAKPPSAHISRVVVEEEGEELEILRHSLPYGTTSENGLYFVAYAASPHPFRRMLERMVSPDADGPADSLLDFTQAVTGAAFFAPSQNALKAQSAKR